MPSTSPSRLHARLWVVASRAATLSRAIGGVAASWPRAIGGVAAVEFALILPVMVTMLLGMSEVTLGVNLDRKLTLLSRSLADLSSRASSMSTSEMGSIFAAASAILRPYDSTTAQMVVTSVTVTKSGSTYSGAVDWSCGKNLSNRPSFETQAQFDGATNLQVRAKSSSYPVPSGFQSDTTKSFIVVETLLPYKPIFGYIVTGTMRLRENTPWPVRDVDRVTGPSPCPT